MIINPYIYATSSYSYLLDAYTGANTAFSMFKLREAYSGSCLRVRRSSDNTEQDIGFVDNYLDETSLTSFVGANDGFVVKWYDQSGNANNLSQATASNQPQIVSSGSIIKRNGIAVISADTGKYLNLSTAPTLNSSFSWWLSYEKTLTTNQSIMFRDTTNILYSDSGTTQNIGNNAGSNISITISSSLSANTFRLMNVITNVVTTSYNGGIYSNGVSLGSTTKTITSGSIIGGYGTLPSSSFRTAKIYFNEFVVWLTDQSSNQSGIESNINSRNLIY